LSLNLESERFGLAIRLLLAYAFGRPESEQNSSHAPRRYPPRILPATIKVIVRRVVYGCIGVFSLLVVLIVIAAYHTQ
jgi:hypothetical protein